MAIAAVKDNSYTNGIASNSHSMSDSAKQKSEAYQLPRNRQESVRLNAQHVFMRDLNDGHQTHPCIPADHVTAIADVACGLGIWLMHYASRLAPDNKTQLACFDVSSSQFPETQSEHIKFVAHNMTRPFPIEYHNTFDLVNIRLAVATIPVADLEKTILNILDIMSLHLQ